jgi:hypothetical protein
MHRTILSYKVKVSRPIEFGWFTRIILLGRKTNHLKRLRGGQEQYAQPVQVVFAFSLCPAIVQDHLDYAQRVFRTL